MSFLLLIHILWSFLWPRDKVVLCYTVCRTLTLVEFPEDMLEVDGMFAEQSLTVTSHTHIFVFIEEGFLQKRRLRFSLLFGGQNLFYFLILS